MMQRLLKTWEWTNEEKIEPEGTDNFAGVPGRKTNQKGLPGSGLGASCPRSQENAGRDKAFGLWLFPVNDIK